MPSHPTFLSRTSLAILWFFFSFHLNFGISLSIPKSVLFSRDRCPDQASRPAPHTRPQRPLWPHRRPPLLL